jgi:hypothetical protein
MSVVPAVVSDPYYKLVEQFREAAEDANLTVQFSAPVKACFTASSSNSFQFQLTLYLRNWRCRRLAKSQHMDVVMHVLELVTRSGSKKVPVWALAKSTVYLNYIIAAGSRPKIAQCVHFDFEEGGKQDHPLFHMQLSANPISTKEMKKSGCVLKIQPVAHGNKCWVTTRIPTSDMTFASVLYCIAADHLGGAHFAGFAERARKLENDLPQPRFDALKDSFTKTDKHLKSSHWFAHML